jgi:hypothetical protein
MLVSTSSFISCDFNRFLENACDVGKADIQNTLRVCCLLSQLFCECRLLLKK